MTNGRYDRQELLFGREGQDKLEAQTVAIVGLGGLGSHVAQQLAYLGVRAYALIDHDHATLSNLNRLVGATEDDARRSSLKTDIAERMIKTILPSARVTSLADTFISDEAFALLKQTDFVFGCVDHDGARLVLNEFCQAYERPYLDLASDIDPETKDFGGRFLYSDGRVCVSCRELLDERAVRLAFSTESQRQEEERIYGIRRGALGEAGPAVVSLNGIIASVAVTEYMVEITGVRPAYLHGEYKGMMGVLTRDRNLADFGCYYCKSLRGQGAAADIEHYIREGWGNRWLTEALKS